MDLATEQQVWRGILDANTWWTTGAVAPHRSRGLRRLAFPTVYEQLLGSDRGRGVVLLGPRRTGKTVMVHQLAEQLLADGVPPDRILLLTLDDVALRGCDLGELLALVERRRPWASERPRFLLLDEIQHSAQWSGWLKRIADRRDPYTFFATGSSATALRHGSQDAGVGRWRELVLLPWSFREHVELRGLSLGSLDGHGESWVSSREPPDPDRLDDALVDYFVRGGFPEVAEAEDAPEARRRLRQDILDRTLGRDVLDAEGADVRLLERMFLRICLAPGGLWNESEVARDLQVSRPTVARYLGILERTFLVFRLPNLASPVKGRPKVYPSAPALRTALLGLGEEAVREPDEWGRLAENAVAATVLGSRPHATSIGFWRKGGDECDVVVVAPDRPGELVEVKRSGRRARRGIERAAAGLRLEAAGHVLTGRDAGGHGAGGEPGPGPRRIPAALWLYQQEVVAGGRLRLE